MYPFTEPFILRFLASKTVDSASLSSSVSLNMRLVLKYLPKGELIRMITEFNMAGLQNKTKQDLQRATQRKQQQQQNI